MNISKNINKLLLAIRLNGKNVKIDSKMYFSEKSGKYITKYIFYERRVVENRYGEEKEKWVELFSDYGKVKLLKYIVKFYNQIGSGVDGE